MATRKKAAAKKKTAPKTTASRTAPRRAAPTGLLLPLSPEERWRMIAEAAYYLAQRRGFGGDAVADWLAAEAEVDARLGAEGRHSGDG